MLSLTCVLLVIRRRCLASPFAVFQSSIHSFLIVCLIMLTLAVFSDLCLKGVAFMPLDCAAAFAALSAISFPSMSLWPGIHAMCRSIPREDIRLSMLLRSEQRMDCPDCLPGLTVALIAAWLSA